MCSFCLGSIEAKAKFAGESWITARGKERGNHNRYNSTTVLRTSGPARLVQ